ncbi:major capsid protein [Rhodococcus sp. PD04]|uniref:major capsid protein n=1 Tax=Rhodococcus sp. PD04 TaxID=3109594 RepID=UPI002DD8B97E|nr:major capsid protein [Rhodococcus sp. PD04]WSE24386.1 major capsid protein [Rhodococcus sp. PD04]
MNALLPQLTGRALTVDAALSQPTIIRDRIARLADSQMVMSRFFSSLGKQVEGGGILYSVAKSSDLYATGVERRSPGAEYPVVEGVDREPKLAVVEDFGGKFQIFDEQTKRNDVSYLDGQVNQLANTVTAKVDAAAMAAVAAADIDSIVATAAWDETVLDGSAPTAPAERPTGTLAQVLEVFETDAMGIVPDTLLVAPQEARVLRTLYGRDLGAVLDSFGLTLVSNARLEAGAAYVLRVGEVGTVGFEEPLRTEVYDDRSTRSKWVQTFCVPAFAVEKPYAAKKLTALASV